LPDRVASHFGLQDAEQIDHFAADVRTGNFLNRDAEGNYAFAHKSFMEFFAASRLHRLMLRDQATANGPVKINEEIRLFLHGLFALEPKEEPGPPYAPPEGFVWVPPGEFILGGPDGLDMQIARLAEGLFVARYPVTNAEYARFVAAAGRETPKHWNGRRPSSERADHPVVYVDWRDALAYAEWADKRLPTEHEWARAARGNDGRVYPWGDAWDETRCNTRESGPGTTTPVGAYSPAGDSPYGLADVAGNVWEWTSTDQGGLRVLRGGSWASNRSYARCAYRLRFNPADRNDLHGGFRVVVSRA
jgi:formylglycine-generating enzyme required for sulfatase activity